MDPVRHYWRSAYEAYSLFGWGAAVLVSAWVALREPLPPGPFYYLGTAAAVMMAVRLHGALRVWRYRASLAGRPVSWVTTEELQAKMDARPGEVWLGYGFDWGREQMQRLYDLGKVRRERLRPPWLYTRLAGRRAPPSKGDSAIHGIEPVERDVYVPLKDLAGHLFVTATTGSIKTRLLALLVAQAIRRRPHETVVIVDPKGDHDLRRLVEAECQAAGRSADFFTFHPAFPSQSVRLDPLRNWARPTEIASRIAALIPSEAGGDAFSAFGWRVINLIAQGLVFVDRRPNLVSLKRYIEGGPDGLVDQALRRHLQDLGIDEGRELQPDLSAARKSKQRPTPTTPDALVARVAYYKRELMDRHGHPVVDGLIAVYEHDRAHMGKMVTSLIPVLTMLTAGELAGLLSPDWDDPDDPRPAIDTARVINAGQVLYVGLDALSDATIAHALGSILLADMAAVAGARQNAGAPPNAVNLFVDEANEVVNEPFVQILNKSRSAGFRAVFATQTVADFVARTGSEAVARQILGNSNNLIAGRTRDKLTAEYATETFGQAVLRSVQEQGSESARAGDGDLLRFQAGYGWRTIEALEPVVTPDTLSRLPDLEYFGVFAGNRIVKARIPLVRQEVA